MSDNIQIGLELNDGGSIAKVTKDITNLRTVLTDVESGFKRVSAAAASTDTTSTGGTATKAKLKAASAPTPSMGSSTSNGDGGGIPYAKAAGREYDAMRGTIGTGSGARDFARESEGLGGLVRLYAVFAANIYAASAAFNALSEAMNTAHLIQGLDQLGAATGRNLGRIAKQLNEVTGGALSMQQSMKSVAQLSATGMNTANILKLGQVAKLASQALGREMTDAIDRLSLGISKQEPRLLDELGILVNVTKAHQDYALKIGKSANSLTTFEKQQAFANATLDQGLKKFSDIQIDTNPYTKLTAALSDLSVHGLSAVNMILGPVVKMFAESPTALAGAVGLIATTLISKAIPAIGQYREGLEKASQSARDNLIAQQKLREEHREYADRNIINAATSSSEAAIATTAELSTSLRPSIAKLLPTQENLVGAELHHTEAVQKNIDVLKTQQMLLESKILTDQRSIASRDKDVASLKAGIAVYEQNIRDQQALHQLQSIPAEPGRFTKEAADLRRLKVASVTDTRLGIVSDTAKSYDLGGISDAWSKLNTGIKKAREEADQYGQKMTALQAGHARLSGTIAITSGVINTLGSAMQQFGVAAAVIGIVWEGINLAFSTNAKEAAAVAAGFDTLRTSAEFVDKVLDKINSKDRLERFSTESMVARSTAFTSLADNMSEQFEKIQKARDKMSTFDINIDKIKSKLPFVDDLLRKSAKETANSIAQMLKAVQPGELKTAKVAELKDIIGVDPQNIEAATKKMVENGWSSFDRIKTDTLPILRKLGNELGNVSAAAKQLDDSFTAASKTFDTILVSALPTTPIAKLGLEMLQLGTDMTEALKDPITSLNQLQKISSDTSKLRFFSPETASYLAKQSEAIAKDVELISGYDKQLEDLSTKQAKFNDLKIEGETKKAQTSEGRTVFSDKDKKALEAATVDLDKTNQSMDKINAQRAAVIERERVNLEKLNQGTLEIYIKSANLVQNAIEQGFAIATLAVRANLATGLSGTLAGSQLSADIQKQQIDLQIEQNKTTLGLIDSNEALRSQLELNRASEDIKKLTAGPEQTRLAAQIQTLEAFKKNPPQLKELIDLMNKGAKDTASIADKAIAEVARGAVTAANQRAGTKIAESNLEGQKKAVTFTESLDEITKKYAITKEILDSQINQATISKSMLDIAKSQQGYLNDQAAAEEQSLARTILIKQQKEETNAIAEKEAKATATKNSKDATDADRLAASKALTQIGGERARLELRQLGARASLEAQLGSAEITRLNIIYSIKSDTQAKELTSANTLNKINIDSQISELDFEGKKLDYLNSLGLVNEDSYRIKKRSNELLNIELNLVQQLADLETSRGTATLAIEKQIHDAALANNMLAVNRALDDQDRLDKETVAKRGQFKEAADKAIAIANLDKDMDARTKHYADTFTSSISTMSDALVDFATTGKISFSGMIKSMLIDLAKFEMRKTLTDATMGLKGKIIDKLKPSTDTSTDIIKKAGLSSGRDGSPTKPLVVEQSAKDILSPAADTSLSVDQQSLKDYTDSLITDTSDSFKSVFDKQSPLLSSITNNFESTFGDLSGIFNKLLTNAFSSIGSSGGSLLDGIASFFGGSSGSSAPAAGGVSSMSDYASSLFAGFAKGGVFEQGQQAFAKGGTFTNSVVTSPTTFAFAKGTGIMGEAGPEAIMPLTRGPNGSLGVQNHGGGGGKVDVVVNNYGYEKATTTQTTDSRGNRKIQVIIGEAVASEMTRSNSPVQTSMRNTFGIQPALTRR